MKLLIFKIRVCGDCPSVLVEDSAKKFGYCPEIRQSVRCDHAPPERCPLDDLDECQGRGVCDCGKILTHAGEEP